MKRILKWTIRVLAVALALPIMALSVWYIAFFRPHLDELKAQAEKGNNAIAPIKASFYPLAIASEGERGIMYGASRYSYQSFSSRKEEPNLAWHFNGLMWMYASKMHFNDKQIFGIWVNCILLGCDKGLPQAAKIYYGREITALTYRDQAGLIVLLKAPMTYGPGTDRSEKRIKTILERAKPYNISIDSDGSAAGHL